MTHWMDDVTRITGMIFDHEAVYLYECATQAKHGIAEIGSYLGQSATALAKGSQAGGDVPVWCIDPHEPYTVDKHTYTAKNRAYFMQNVVTAGVAETVRLINLPSQQVARCWERKLDVLFIDGDHRYEAVLADLRAWYGHMVPGGVMLIHDCHEDGVKRAIAEFAQYDWVTVQPGKDRIARVTIHEQPVATNGGKRARQRTE